MSETRIPKFDWGQRVTASIDLFNDGSHPESELDALLVGQGTAGEVVQVGMHEESSTPVYMVEFDSQRVVGCLEEEIALVQAREA
jgi:nitrogen fixation protein NifZ